MDTPAALLRNLVVWAQGAVHTQHLSPLGVKPKAVLGQSCPSSVYTSQPHSHPNACPCMLPLPTSGQIPAKPSTNQNKRTTQVEGDLWCSSGLALLKARLTPNPHQVFFWFCFLLLTCGGWGRQQEHPWHGKDTGDKGDNPQGSIHRVRTTVVQLPSPILLQRHQSCNLVRFPAHSK